MTQGCARILGVGSYLPARIVTNHDLARTLDTSHEWIAARTGIHQRHIAREDEMTSDLAVQACQAALHKAQREPHQVDLLILATCSGDHTFPATAVRVQEKLGIPDRCLAFDVGGVCGGFVLALMTAELYLRGGMFRRALVVGAESMSRLVDWSDRNTAILFGDGAGALVLEWDETGRQGEDGILAACGYTDGASYDLMHTRGGVCQKESLPGILMNGREVFKRAVAGLAEVSQVALSKTKYTLADVSLMVPHQANKRILEAVAERLSLPPQKIFSSMDRHANTSAASIPLALAQALAEGVAHKGDLVLSQAFGAGLVRAACLYRL